MKLIDNPRIWNIDKWIISRSTKISYSWSIKGKNKEIKYLPFTGLMNIILTILSNGWWHLLITNQNINSNIFLHYAQKLYSWIHANNLFGHNQVILLMDNCPSHKSKLTNKLLNTISFETYFILTYSPDLTPVELWFALTKRIFSKICKAKKVNLKSKESRIQPLSALKLLINNQIKNLFKMIWSNQIIS